MSRYPGAIWKPLPENAYQASIVPTQVILHSAVDAHGPTRTLYGFFNSTGVYVESHFYIRWDGTIEQYLDTEVRADCNRYANRRPDGTGAISIETEDDGNPNGNPWSPEQIESIIRIILWANVEHGVPLRVCRAHDDPGLGYHVMWGAPGAWTPARGKTCPGTVRIEQFHDVIVPAITIGATAKDLTMNDDTANGLAMLAYTSLLFRLPTLQEIGANADQIKSEGLTFTVARIANSEEARNARALLRTKMGLS